MGEAGRVGADGLHDDAVALIHAADGLRQPGRERAPGSPRSRARRQRAARAADERRTAPSARSVSSVRSSGGSGRWSRSYRTPPGHWAKRAASVSQR